MPHSRSTIWKSNRIRLVIIASPEDTQAKNWEKIVNDIGYSTIYLDVRDAGREWYIEAGQEARIVTENKCIYLCDKSYRWYIRGPNIAAQHVIQQIEMLHSLLTLIAYPEHRYFMKGGEEGTFGSKLFQLRHCPCPVPFTKITTNTMQRSREYIVKSLSQIRSTVVSTSDDRMQKGRGLHIEQEAIYGKIIVKAHVYIRNDRVMHSMAVECISNNIDYREDNGVEYKICDFDSRLQYIAHECYLLIGTRFFDIDIFIDSGGLTLLEINFSPAPTYFEKFFDHKAAFSRAVLYDFLSSGV